jgi:hypothetical protein
MNDQVDRTVLPIRRPPFRGVMNKTSVVHSRTGIEAAGLLFCAHRRRSGSDRCSDRRRRMGTNNIVDDEPAPVIESAASAGDHDRREAPSPTCQHGRAASLASGIQLDPHGQAPMSSIELGSVTTSTKSGRCCVTRRIEILPKACLMRSSTFGSGMSKATTGICLRLALSSASSLCRVIPCSTRSMA